MLTNTRHTYEIILDTFQGPLDLLLHLIQKNEMDIHEISISSITDQYINFINLMEELDLDLASEYLSMATTLLQIKSQSILPSAPNDDHENRIYKDREELVRQLLEYKHFKSASIALDHRADLRNRQHGREIDHELTDLREFVIRATVFDLITAFQKLRDLPKFDDLDDDNFQTIEEEKITVEEKIAFVSESISHGEPISFTELFSQFTTKTEKIVTFLAILELVRLRQVVSIQTDHFSEIYIQKRKAS